MDPNLFPLDPSASLGSNFDLCYAACPWFIPLDSERCPAHEKGFFFPDSCPISMPHRSGLGGLLCHLDEAVRRMSVTTFFGEVFPEDELTFFNITSPCTACLICPDIITT